MLSLPMIRIVDYYILVLLPTVCPAYVLNGNCQCKLPNICTDMAAISIGLFLIIVLDFPDDLILNNGRERGYVREIGGVEKEFHLFADLNFSG